LRFPRKMVAEEPRLGGTCRGELHMTEKKKWKLKGREKRGEATEPGGAGMVQRQRHYMVGTWKPPNVKPTRLREKKTWEKVLTERRPGKRKVQGEKGK